MVSYGGSLSRNGRTHNNPTSGNAPDAPGGFITSKFWVEIGSVVRAYFKECSGLQMETEVTPYAEGGLNTYTHKLPGRTSVGNITLKRGLVQDDELWDWYSAVVNGKMDRRTVSILLYENKGQSPSQPVVAWVLKDAMPIKWVGPSFRSDENAVAVDQLEFICGSRDGSGALTRQIGTRKL